MMNGTINIKYLEVLGNFEVLEFWYICSTLLCITPQHPKLSYKMFRLPVSWLKIGYVLILILNIAAVERRKWHSKSESDVSL